jgi:hypothetical protein
MISTWAKKRETGVADFLRRIPGIIPDFSFRTAIGLFALASCFGKPGSEPQPGNAALLAGRWEFMLHRVGHPDILGIVTLQPSDPDDPSVPRGLKGGTLEGHFELQSQGWLATPPSDSGASAYLDADSSIVLYLRLEGRCTRCGNLGLAGHLAGSRVTGHWTQEYTSDPPEGAFELTRSTVEE